MKATVVFEAPEDLELGEMTALIHNLQKALPHTEVSYPLVRRKPEDPLHLKFYIEVPVIELQAIYQAAQSVAPRGCPVQYPVEVPE